MAYWSKGSDWNVLFDALASKNNPPAGAASTAPLSNAGKMVNVTSMTLDKTVTF